MSKEIRTAHKKELLKLPRRPWSEVKTYDSLIIFPSGRKHDSEWGMMTLIGCNDMKPIEVITENTDDIEVTGGHKTDCLFPSHALHYWHPRAVFMVSAALSSMTIEVLEL